MKTLEQVMAALKRKGNPLRIQAFTSHGARWPRKWRKAKRESVASSGWNTFSGYVTTTADDELDLDDIEATLAEIEASIDSANERVKYTMNGFVIAVGSYVKPLSKKAKATARRLGEVEVDMGGTSCEVPLATEVIGKVEKAGRIGKKRKTIKC